MAGRRQRLKGSLSIIYGRATGMPLGVNAPVSDVGLASLRNQLLEGAVPEQFHRNLALGEVVPPHMVWARSRQLLGEYNYNCP